MSLRTTERSARLACLALKDHIRKHGLDALTAIDIVLISETAADESEQIQRSLLAAGREPDRVVVV